MGKDDHASVVRSPTCCRASEKAVTEHPPSGLTSSIPPGADKVQHYIAAIKYSEAQYNQVNLSSEAPHAAEVMNQEKKTCRFTFCSQVQHLVPSPPAGVTG